MANKVFIGKVASQTSITSDKPDAGTSGIAMSSFSGPHRADRWLITSEIVASSPDDADLDLSVGTSDLDTVVAAKSLRGADGNGVTVTVVGDSGVGDGVSIEEDLDDLAVVIHYESGVSTVEDVEDAITESSTLIEVKTTGTAATVLTAPGDDVAATELAGGTSSSNTYSLILYGRDPTTKRWGLHSDAYGNVKNGSLGTMLPGRQSFVIRDLGVYDRVMFIREGSGSDSVNVTVSEILSAGRGN